MIRLVLLLFIVMMAISPCRSFAAFPVQEGKVVTAQMNRPLQQTPQDAPEKGGGFGIASLAAGAIAFPVYILGAIDLLFTGGVSQFHILAAIIAFAALILGGIGTTRKLKGLAIAGIALSLLTLIPFMLLLLGAG